MPKMTCLHDYFWYAYILYNFDMLLSSITNLITFYFWDHINLRYLQWQSLTFLQISLVVATYWWKVTILSSWQHQLVVGFDPLHSLLVLFHNLYTVMSILLTLSQHAEHISDANDWLFGLQYCTEHLIRRNAWKMKTKIFFRQDTTIFRLVNNKTLSVHSEVNTRVYQLTGSLIFTKLQWGEYEVPLEAGKPHIHLKMHW